MNKGSIASLTRYQSGIDGSGFIEPGGGKPLVFFSSRVFVGDFTKASKGMKVLFDRYVGYEEARRVQPTK